MRLIEQVVFPDASINLDEAMKTAEIVETNQRFVYRTNSVFTPTRFPFVARAKRSYWSPSSRLHGRKDSSSKFALTIPLSIGLFRVSRHQRRPSIEVCPCATSLTPTLVLRSCGIIRKVVQRMASVQPADCTISTITSYEPLTGVEKCAKPRQRAYQS